MCCYVRRRPRRDISRAYSLLRIRPLMCAVWAISSRCSPRHSLRLFPVLTSNRSGEREEEEGGGDADEGGAIRATAAATAASRCKESCAGERARAEGRRVTRERKIRTGEEVEGGRETYTYLAKKRRGRDPGLAQKRANVDKIGGGSLQLLAGMSGNAWDSILKARPRQSPSPPHPLQPSLFSRLSSTAIPRGPYLVQGDPGNTSRLPDRVARSPRSHRVLNPRTTLTRCAT